MYLFSIFLLTKIVILYIFNIYRITGGEVRVNIFLNNSSGIPLYEQLSEQIKNQILLGSLKKEEPMPSMRALAASLRVSVITTKLMKTWPVRVFYIRFLQRAILLPM